MASFLRLRRGLFGYRKSDVVAELERLHAQLDRLATSLDQTWRQKETLGAELESVRDRHAQELERERLRIERVEAEARAEAARRIASAEEQAARIRTDAGRSVAEAATRLENLLRVREQVLGELRGILQAYGSLLAEVDQGHTVPPVPAEHADALRDVHAPATPVADRVAGNGDLFPRQVEIDAGPFADFAELSAFERSLARLPKVEDVYIRRFGDDRAEIELTLSEERPLIHDLNSHLPYRVAVTADDGRLQVEVAGESAAAPGA